MTSAGSVDKYEIYYSCDNAR